jgi:hypothetical protein
VYPPFTLFGLWPLGNATYNEAVAAWSLVPLLLYFVLVVLLAKRSGLGIGTNPAGAFGGSRMQAYAVLIAFSLPFVSANLFSGQTGTIIAVFFLGAAYFWPTRPVLAGVCIGLLAIKPQMGLLMPFVLMASGQWRNHRGSSGNRALADRPLDAMARHRDLGGLLPHEPVVRQLIGAGYDQIRQLAVGPYVSLQGAGMPAALAGFFPRGP